MVDFPKSGRDLSMNRLEILPEVYHNWLKLSAEWDLKLVDFETESHWVPLCDQQRNNGRDHKLY